MDVLQTNGWDQYELIDSGDGYRLEKFGKYTLQRPDPQVIWKKKAPESLWQKADAIFQRTTADKGQWVKENPLMSQQWPITYKNITLQMKLSPFKHTGVFPEQHIQWDSIESAVTDSAKQGKSPRILNLFAYTGAASLIAAQSGASVTHVDASKPAIAWARENQHLSHLDDKPIRWILDDCVKFLQREVKRGVKYDGIIMDPPVFGHGPQGNIWKFNDFFPELMELSSKVLSDTPLFIIVNAYAISSSSIMLENVFMDYFPNLGGNLKIGELALKESMGGRLLSTGQYLSWQH